MVSIVATPIRVDGKLRARITRLDGVKDALPIMLTREQAEALGKSLGAFLMNCRSEDVKA